MSKKTELINTISTMTTDQLESLNKNIAEELAKRYEKATLTAKRKLKVGDMCTCNDKRLNGKVLKIVKINQKNAICIEKGTDKAWSVPVTMIKVKK